MTGSFPEVPQGEKTAPRVTSLPSLTQGRYSRCGTWPGEREELLGDARKMFSRALDYLCTLATKGSVSDRPCAALISIGRADAIRSRRSTLLETNHGRPRRAHASPARDLQLHSQQDPRTRIRSHGSGNRGSFPDQEPQRRD